MQIQTYKNSSIFAIIVFIFLDQLTKYIVRAFRGFYICNKGIAFGINLPNWLLIFSVAVILCFIGLLILNSEFKTLDKISNFPLILIFSGAISNLIDRLYFGCVIDFINLKVWPIFNLADIFICVGVFFLIIKFYKK